MKTKTITGAEAKKMREKIGMNQTQFWSLIGVTQSAGSRYEGGRSIPLPVQKLLTIAYGTEKESALEAANLWKWR